MVFTRALSQLPYYKHRKSFSLLFSALLLSIQKPVHRCFVARENPLPVMYNNIISQSFLSFLLNPPIHPSIHTRKSFMHYTLFFLSFIVNMKQNLGKRPTSELKPKPLVVPSNQKHIKSPPTQFDLLLSNSRTLEEKNWV